MHDSRPLKPSPLIHLTRNSISSTDNNNYAADCDRFTDHVDRATDFVDGTAVNSALFTDDTNLLADPSTDTVEKVQNYVTDSTAGDLSLYGIHAVWFLQPVAISIHIML